MNESVGETITDIIERELRERQVPPFLLERQIGGAGGPASRRWSSSEILQSFCESTYVLDSHTAAAAHDHGSRLDPAPGFGQVLVR